MLAIGGAIHPHRDSVDQALVAGLENSTGKIGSRIDYPDLKLGEKVLDTDGDGIADEWKKRGNLIQLMKKD